MLRLSAIGDTCHALAALRALQAAWPQARFTWIIGKLEARLFCPLLPEVEFITFDKGAWLPAMRRLRRVLRARRFDLLLDMQLSLRASLISTLVRSPVKLGFDRRRARELHWLFTNASIEPAGNEHVLDSLLGFVRACGIETGAPRWDLVIPEEAHEYARRVLPADRPALVISPCSTHALRNWSPERYAAVADHAITAHGMCVVLAGGPSAGEARMGEAIERSMHRDAVNQIGKDTLPQMLGLLARSAVLLTPDSGPAHMATMVGTPVIGLYAATNPARSGPYCSLASCVDKYAEAAAKFLGRPVSEIPWTTKIERRGVMDLIGIAEVAAKLDALMARRDIR